MGIRLPYIATGPLPSEASAFNTRMMELMDRGGFFQGYVRCDLGSTDSFLFLHQGKTHCAGELTADRFAASTIDAFFARLREARSVAYYTTDLPLFLCTAVLFRKAPSAQVPLDLVDTEKLLESVRETRKDAVLVLRRNDDRNLVFCMNGALAALYAADEAFPHEGPIADRVVEYVLGNRSSSQTTLDVYDEIRLQPASDAGLSLVEHQTRAVPKPSAPTPTLVVRLGRVAFQFPITRDEIMVGRGEPNDLALDNLSVSRRHAILRKKGEALSLEDLGSENGVVVRGRRMKHVEMRPGDEVRIGKYVVSYPRYNATVTVDHAPPPSPLAALETTVPDKVYGLIEHKGRTHPVKGIIFNIGAARRAHLRISGVLIAPVHVQVQTLADGMHRITHVGGQRHLRVNGKRVRMAEIVDGDEFTIGPHRFHFRSVFASTRTNDRDEAVVR